jgi:2'-5' RNA ligase
LRAFLASTLPGGLHDELAGQIELLAQRLPRGAVRWVKPENIHLTLKFLGEVTIDQAHRVENALRPIIRNNAPFGLQASGLGAFPNFRRPSVIWVGVEGEKRRLLDLQASLDAALVDVGFEPESRPFHAHLTLGRVRRNVSRHDLRTLSDTLSDVALGTLGDWRVESLVLMKSDLHPDGPRYTPVMSLDLGAQAEGQRPGADPPRGG